MKEVQSSTIFNISELHRYISSEFRVYFSKYDISLTYEQFHILCLLEELKVVNQQKLSELAGKDKTSLSRQLDILTKMGFVERFSHDTDARKQNVRLTEKGQRKFLGYTVIFGQFLKQLHKTDSKYSLQLSQLSGLNSFGVE